MPPLLFHRVKSCANYFDDEFKKSIKRSCRPTVIHESEIEKCNSAHTIRLPHMNTPIQIPVRISVYGIKTAIIFHPPYKQISIAILYELRNDECLKDRVKMAIDKIPTECKMTKSMIQSDIATGEPEFNVSLIPYLQNHTIKILNSPYNDAFKKYICKL